MSRTRLSTTVDAELLGSARTMRTDITDAALIDKALGVLLQKRRSAEVDATYAAAYSAHPIEGTGQSGDLGGACQR